ncbi:MAG: 3-oxoacyl-ACP reductase FabG [Deltaproteobacteria bacterium]|nr:3-oxoacyl-ACP reductase FabG [Deltaproteobacteria bacterium]
MSEQKTALVTGGSRGIGRAVCLELAGAGYYVLVNYRTQEAAAKETLIMIMDAGGGGELCPFDVTDQPTVAACLKDLTGRLGFIEVLVNNAGVAADGLFGLMPPEDWHRVVDTTLSGFYNVTKPLLKPMLAKKRGSIISISSVSALVGNRGQTNYAAAKAGLIGASRALAGETARAGVRVNVVAPGLIETEMTADMPRDRIKQLIPMARLGRPEEIARVVAFLCSDAASYITGQVLSVNGGML